MTKIGLIALLGAAVTLFTTGANAQVGPGPKAMTRRFPVPKSRRTAETANDGAAEEKYLDTLLDHFDAEGRSTTFKMRYLVDKTYWDPETGPILFYAGNEGDVYSFYDNTGFMTETIAKETKGLIVFGEHRYFGVSYPFEPSEAFTPEHNVYLTVEQVMMDYVELVKQVREDYELQDKACIVFGGSYGGMLAAWLRHKHPQTFQGALAASAPFLYFKDAPSAPEYAYADIATTDFSTQLEKSPELIKETFGLMMNSTSDQWTEMSTIFNTCTPISNSSDVLHLYQHYSNGYQYMAMTDYPYPASFLEPMPAWPIKEAVKPFANIPSQKELELIAHLDTEPSKSENGLSARERQLYEALAESTNVYFNYTGDYKCTNLSDWEGTGDLDGYGWNILACNQLAMPIGYGNDSMFLEQAFDYDEYTKFCQEEYGLTPDYTWALRYFGGFNIDKDFLAATNVIYSNGELDPWRAGGLNKNVTADGSGIALYIEGGAHHLDLRPPNDQDPATVTNARNIEMANIKKWIAEYQNIEPTF